MPSVKLPSPEVSDELPVLPLRDVVVYPHMVIPLFVGRDRSIRALDEAMRSNKQILLLAQRGAEIDDPGTDDLYSIGTRATVLQLLKLPDGTVKVLVEGVERAGVIEYIHADDYFSARVAAIQDDDAEQGSTETDALTRSALGVFEQYVKLNKKVPPDVLSSLAGIEDPSRLADTLAAHMALKLDQK